MLLLVLITTQVVKIPTDQLFHLVHQVKHLILLVFVMNVQKEKNPTNPAHFAIRFAMLKPKVNAGPENGVGAVAGIRFADKLLMNALNRTGSANTALKMPK